MCDNKCHIQSFDKDSSYIKITKHTKKLINEARHLNLRSGYSKMNNTLSNFHTDHLKERIQNNQLIQYLYKSSRIKTGNIQSFGIPKIKTKLFSKSTRLETSQTKSLTSTNYCSVKHSYTNGYTSSNANTMNKTISSTSKQKKITSGIHPRTRNFFNGQIFNPDTRIESLSQFTSKIRETGREKYVLSVRNEWLEKKTQDAKTKVDQVNLDINNYTTSFELFKLFKKEYVHYERRLNEILSDEQVICNTLKNHRNQLAIELQRLKKKQSKLLQMFNDSYKSKFFLMCVKNHSNKVENFCFDDIIEYKSDQYLVKNIINGTQPIRKRVFEKKVSINTTNKFRSYRRKHTYKRMSTISQRINSTTASLTLTSMINNVQTMPNEVLTEKSRNIPFFDSIDEFHYELNQIPLRINKSIIKYNQKNEEIEKLKMEKEANAIDFEGNEKRNKLIQIEIKEDEESLSRLKKKNQKLISLLKSIPPSEEKLTKLNKKISKMASEIYEKFPVEHLIPNCKKKKQFIPLETIEKTLEALLHLHKEYKGKYPVEYNKQKQGLEKEKKENLTKILIQQEKLKLIEKNNKIIEKSKKLIIKPLKKVNRPVKISKDNKLKQNIEKFSGGNLADFFSND